ncbi:hypothetical protein [Mucilaginibacter polytrichastri]|uniref:Uncharacterized protein n=1 Tax=Mucilaginibacter polytrichastri TaxID=1302689 RepID=A0A1Q5ZTJ4_9SPHI|nr:hypothetical protein [Mucilaginibacter polytrichastri]OKS85090.1 hypothetical protein RG47T_0529 [Mucilaginibacter polytrichastri]SFS44686.1 hypothetical protein SAMN04487890_101550 [Mucilaginibacter polytrichastri]
MLKDIVIFLKIKVFARQKPHSLLAQRFGKNDNQSDRNQWNGYRHLTLKEIQATDFNNTLGVKAGDKHVS